MTDTIFDSKSAIVTGAASGIGREIAGQLASAGAHVLLTDVNEAAVAEAASELGDRAAWMRVDVSNRDDLQAAVDHVVDIHGQLDYMFNNAGVAIFGPIDAVTLDDWDQIVDVNFRGVAYGATIAYRQMVKQGAGHIVNTASVAGLVPVPLQAQYCATKHAVVGFSKTLGLEAAGHGVNVTVLCPAFVESGMFDNNTFRGELEGVDAREIVPIKPLATAIAVKKLLAGVRRRKRVVIVPVYGRIGWWLERITPSLSFRLHRITLKVMRRRARTNLRQG